jgi:hypothetical protein
LLLLLLFGWLVPSCARARGRWARSRAVNWLARAVSWRGQAISDEFEQLQTGITTSTVQSQEAMMQLASMRAQLQTSEQVMAGPKHREGGKTSNKLEFLRRSLFLIANRALLLSSLRVSSCRSVVR